MTTKFPFAVGAINPVPAGKEVAGRIEVAALDWDSAKRPGCTPQT